MKKLFKVALVAACMVMVGSFAKAQTKIGYINFNQLIDQMPESKTIQKQAQDYQKTFIDVLQGMQTEFQTKAQAYEAKRATMTDALRTQTETELQDLQKRIQDYQQSASQKVQEKYNELSKPLIEKARGAVNTVAKEKGYTYVIDTAQVDLIVSPPTDNLMDAVKAKLGLK
jgi:outer membrane protein